MCHRINKINKNSDLLLLFPSFNNDTFYQLRFDWNLGASYILAYLKEKGIHASQFIQKEPIDMCSLIKRILAYSPKIVGFTCNDVSYYYIKLISKELKKRRKDIIIIVGGPTATFSDRLILKDTKAIDICVRGEGEETIAELIDYIKGKKKNINQIRGISYRYKRKIIRNSDRPLLRSGKKDGELDIFPSPYLSGVLPDDGSIGILTSRGCTYHCTYCNFSAMAKWRVSYHSVERVLSELKMISEAHNNVRFQSHLVPFHDDAFSLNTRRAKEICKRIIEEKISLSFWCESRGDCVDEELLTLMKKANFKIISFGLESAVPENLRTINKVNYGRNIDKDLTKEKKFINKIKVNTKKAQTLGLNVTLSVIIGLPKQNKNQAETTLDFVKNLRPKVYFHDNLMLYPGTPLFNTRKKFGLDIIAPKTVLPYKTRFTFDVTKIKMLSNAAQKHSIVDILTDTAINFFSRSTSIFQDSIGIPAVFVNNYASKIGDLVKKNKIKNAITLSPIFLFLQKDRNNIKKDLNELIEKEFPVINLLALRKVNSHRRRLYSGLGLYELIFLTEVIERRRLDFQKLALFIFLPVSYLYRKKAAMKIESKDYHRRAIFLTLNNQEDQINFKKLLLDEDPLKNLLGYNEADYYMINQCQWSDRPCPIIKEKILFMDERGRNILCYNGKNIKNDSKNSFLSTPCLKSKVENYFKEMERRRKCRSCQINKSCSKCLFTFPFSEKEFCDIKRKVNTRKLITTLEKHNRLNSFITNKQFLYNTFRAI